MMDRTILQLSANISEADTFTKLLSGYPIQTACVIFLILFLVGVIIFQVWMNRVTKKWNEELVKANNAKSFFLSKMSHEIRTPLNGINGSLNILAENEGLQDDKYMKIAKTSIVHLIGVINDILDMSKIESGKMELHIGFLSYADLEKKVYDAVLPLAEEKRINITKPVILSPRTGIYADSVRLMQIIVNLMSNAIKYTPEGGRVTLNMDVEPVGEDKEKLRIEVIDEGIGMSETTMSIMYRAFEQEESSGTKLGSGLGLTITKELVELMGGTINIESEEGSGTRVVVEITSTWGTEVLEEEFPTMVEIPEMPDFYGKKALLVEDNTINAEIAKVQLQKLGMTVELAANGKEAVEQFLASEEAYYDVIFMDIMMPIMDGYEATKLIRSAGRPDSENILIVAMTAMAFAEDAEKSRASGMNYHLPKPYDSKGIREILNDAWN